MTPNFYLKFSQIIKVLRLSCHDQWGIIFSPQVIYRYGKTLKIQSQYYHPRRIWAGLTIDYVTALSISLTKGVLFNIIKSFMKRETLSLKNKFTRIKTPTGHSYIISQFLVYITTKYNFRRIVQRTKRTIGPKLYFSGRKVASWKAQVRGLVLTLHGRIPREPVRARKTMQTKTLGRRSKINITNPSFLLNRSEGMNPRLGSFSCWVRLII